MLHSSSEANVTRIIGGGDPGVELSGPLSAVSLEPFSDPLFTFPNQKITLINK